MKTRPLASENGILDLFHRQAASTPGRTAAVDSYGHAITYQELRTQSIAIAAELKSFGQNHGGIVPVFADRTCNAIAAMLGVLEAGAAIMPVDPQSPLQRIETQIRMSGAQVCLAADVPVGPSKIPVINVGSLHVRSLEIGQAPTVSPNDLAYVITTSGSTGEPKLALNSHRGLCHLVDALCGNILDFYGTGLNTAVAAPWSFDPWVQQVFSALIRGDTLFIVDDAARHDGRQLARFYHQHNIEISDGTPSHLRLLAHADPGVPDHLPVRHFIIGGERMLSADVRNFFARYPGSKPKITNIYGVAECAVDSAGFTFARETLPTCPNVPVGRPLGMTTVLIIDEYGAEAPPGQSGELCLTGPGVGLGYLGDPKLTKQKFSVRNGNTVYHTGDQARRLQDGMIEILGRLDHQIKIKGKRVELGEIEAALCDYTPVLLSQGNLVKAGSGVDECRRCALTSAQPGFSLDSAGICNSCRDYERWAPHLAAYWKQPSDFAGLVTEVRQSHKGPYDCLLEFSGGKDSTYVLHRLCESGLRVLCWTFDNGFISETALSNIERTTRELGVPSVIEKINRTNKIFCASLRIDKAVCTGCFRTLTTMSTVFAAKHSIPLIITGLSRGQILDTKLSPLLADSIFDPAEIDCTLLQHRKIYHSKRDFITHALGATVENRMIDTIQFIDYFRYDSIFSSEILNFLKSRDSRWSRPENTGSCSTNCRINDAGIAVHMTMRGYHNYAAPLSFEVRMGQISRNDARRKLSGDLDIEAVRSVLKEIGYNPKITGTAVIYVDHALVAFFTADEEISEDALRTHLASTLPDYMIPARLHQVDALPLNQNGKVDRNVLEQMDAAATLIRPGDKPETTTQQGLAQCWKEALQNEPRGIDENFLAVGDSLAVMNFAVAIEDRFGIALQTTMIGACGSIRALAQEIDSRRDLGLTDGLVIRRGQ